MHFPYQQRLVARVLTTAPIRLWVASTVMAEYHRAAQPPASSSHPTYKKPHALVREYSAKIRPYRRSGSFPPDDLAKRHCSHVSLCNGSGPVDLHLMSFGLNLHVVERSRERLARHARGVHTLVGSGGDTMKRQSSWKLEVGHCYVSNKRVEWCAPVSYSMELLPAGGKTIWYGARCI
jgi:hypothetical protein